MHCGEANSNDILKLRLFPLSLSGDALIWFVMLMPNSIHTWSQLEHQFYCRFWEAGEMDHNIIDYNDIMFIIQLVILPIVIAKLMTTH